MYQLRKNEIKTKKKAQFNFINLSSFENSISSLTSFKKYQKETVPKYILKEKQKKIYNASKLNIETIGNIEAISQALLIGIGVNFLREPFKNIRMKKIAIEPEVIKSQLETDFIISGKEAEILHQNLEHPLPDRVKIRERTLKEALEIYQKNSKNI